jgi:hypothetical protein
MSRGMWNIQCLVRFYLRYKTTDVPMKSSISSTSIIKCILSFPKFHQIQVQNLDRPLKTPTMQSLSYTCLRIPTPQCPPTTGIYSTATVEVLGAYILNCTKIIASSTIVPKLPINHGRFVFR